MLFYHLSGMAITPQRQRVFHLKDENSRRIKRWIVPRQKILRKCDKKRLLGHNEDDNPKRVCYRGFRILVKKKMLLFQSSEGHRGSCFSWFSEANGRGIWTQRFILKMTPRKWLAEEQCQPSIPQMARSVHSYQLAPLIWHIVGHSDRSR